MSYDQLSRGQEVFYRYAGPAIAGLTFQALLGGMGGYRVVETLSRTGGFSVRVARRRLLETFQHILDVTHDIDSLKPEGEGFTSTIRVRFLHANVRRRILALANKAEGKGKSYYDVEKLGVPINDLDSMGTIAAFSATLIWVSLPRQGIWLSEQEKEDYIALWRYLGYLLGAPTEPYFSTPPAQKPPWKSHAHRDPTLGNIPDPGEQHHCRPRRFAARVHESGVSVRRELVVERAQTIDGAGRGKAKLVVQGAGRAAVCDVHGDHLCHEGGA